MTQNIKPFEELSAGEQRMWNNFAQKNQKFLENLSTLKEHGCVWCKKKFPRMAEMEFHIKSTHGIPGELLVEMMGYIK